MGLRAQRLQRRHRLDCPRSEAGPRRRRRPAALVRPCRAPQCWSLCRQPPRKPPLPGRYITDLVTAVLPRGLGASRLCRTVASMKTIIVAGLLVPAVIAAQEYRISRAENALQNAEKNNRDLNDQLSDLLSDNASTYSALLQSRAQTEALSKAHLLARQNL